MMCWQVGYLDAQHSCVTTSCLMHLCFKAQGLFGVSAE